MKDMNKLNYLIFDDHPLVCVAIKSLLEELGKTNGVFTATSAKMALQILKKEENSTVDLRCELGRLRWV